MATMSADSLMNLANTGPKFPVPIIAKRSLRWFIDRSSTVSDYSAEGHARLGCRIYVPWPYPAKRPARSPESAPQILGGKAHAGPLPASLQQILPAGGSPGRKRISCPGDDRQSTNVRLHQTQPHPECDAACVQPARDLQRNRLS